MQRRRQKQSPENLGFVRMLGKAGLTRIHDAIERALPFKIRDLSAEKLKELEEYAFAAKTPAEFRTRYLDSMVLKRWQGDDGVSLSERQATACAKLRDSEVGCRVSNELFTGPESLEFGNAAIPLHLQKIYLRARRILQQMLGTFDPEEFARSVSFSPGATSEFPRRLSHETTKWECSTHVTARAVPYATAWRKWVGPYLSETGEDSPWPEFKAVASNVVFTVPKRFDTERTACKGATWNVALQKGYGTVVRRSAQRWYEPLLQPDAQVLHGLLAKLGSATRLFVTGDLVGASDSIGTGHIKTFFPEDHARVILDLREEYGTFPDGETIRWEKVGSMGNGYTFEVETVLFYAVAKACCKRSELVSVYGDDLIYPQTRHEAIVEAFSFLGFMFNREKTFAGDSPFRESCGGYYYEGVDVKPFFLEAMPTTCGDLIELHNQILAHQPEPNSSWWDVASCIKAELPRRYRGPYGTPGVCWSTWDESCPQYHPKTQSFSVFRVVAVPIREETSSNIGRLLAWRHKGRLRSLRDPRCIDIYWTRGRLTGFENCGVDYLPPDVSVVKERTYQREERSYVDRVQWTERTPTSFSREQIRLPMPALSMA